ncbi:MAG: class I SAM-dependent methyltransferase [Haliscomenobacter sp.]|nr:class I SAM-dependent methyltransferase [Haliscomenobacter sp.]MBK8879186.1 class I SAM-dependent methyltransferase [Haliscomenobacter sp.]
MKLWFFYTQFLVRFLRFYRKAVTPFDIHSPFVADFVRTALLDQRFFYAFQDIEALRQSLLRNPYPIQITDHGAGSQADGRKWRPVSSIARYGAVSPKTGRQLFRMVHHCRPETILELGTSLGISALYLRAASAKAALITLEGCPETASLARVNFFKAGSPPIDVRVGMFSETLGQALKDLKTLDFLYLDGDHRAGASMQYVQACMEKRRDQSVFVLADIHWSAEMETTWETISNMPEVTLAIDLFWIGILFFDPSIKVKQHYQIVPWAAKPWRLGIFR